MTTPDVWAQAGTATFSFGAALFGWLARRSGKQNSKKLDKVQEQTNGQLEQKIREAVIEAVSHDELVRAVSHEAIADYLDGLLYAHLADNDESPMLAKPYGERIRESEKRNAETRSNRNRYRD